MDQGSPGGAGPAGPADPDSQDAVPIFTPYKRGYDPEQVDRYVGEQQRRLDEAQHRASESERKLAAAVGQLRELHRRVAMLESEARSPAPQTLDTLGERVQRILQEAWEGAYALRQEAEREVAEIKENAEQEASQIVETARRRAAVMREETDRRRQAYKERYDEDRRQAVAQITYLYDQRQLALAELGRLESTVRATVEEMARSPLGVPNIASDHGGSVESGPAAPVAPAQFEEASGDGDAADASDEAAEDGWYPEADVPTGPLPAVKTRAPRQPDPNPGFVERASPRARSSVFVDPKPAFSFGGSAARIGDQGNPRGKLASPAESAGGPAGFGGSGEADPATGPAEAADGGESKAPSTSPVLTFSDEGIEPADGDEDATEAVGIVLPSPSLASRLLSGSTHATPSPVAPASSSAADESEGEDASPPADDSAATEAARVPAHRRAGKEGGESSATSRIAGRWARALGAGRSNPPAPSNPGVFDFEAESGPES